MRRYFLAGLICTLSGVTATKAETTAREAQIAKIYAETLESSPAYEQLTQLTTRFPGRLAGSKAYTGAAEWTEATLKTMGFDRVWRQPVTVPGWERGLPESVTVHTDGTAAPVPLTAVLLGWAGSSPEGGAKASVIEVQTLAEVEKLGRAGVEGKIVFFNRPMPQRMYDLTVAYAETGDQRNYGPGLASKLGAVGALVRSLTQNDDDIAHTGNTTFAPGETAIPAFALSTQAADRLSAMLKAHPETQATLVSHAKALGPLPSWNVIGEIRGRDVPDKILLVGGHLDCWDIAPGAHDDGAGVVQAIEVARVFKALGIQPRHTLRVVLFTGEENSSAGAIEYARLAKENGEIHVLGIESDSGAYEPRFINLAHTSMPAHERAARWEPLFAPYGNVKFKRGNAGADVTPLLLQGVTVGQLVPNSQRYLGLHHTKVDTVDKVDPRELELGAAAIASLLYLVDTEGL